MSKRAGQVASEIHQAVQSILDRGLQDPRLSGVLLTVTDVRVSDDVRNATILVSVMPESRADLALHGLQAAAGYIRREAGKFFEIRQMPEFAFKLDKSVKKQAGVLEAIAKATAEREAAEKARAAAQPDSRPDSADAADSRPDAPPA